MQTITFYSYKGGVGRTLALANMSIYLSRFGFNVCVMDFDLEAPGLHYKFSNYLNGKEIKRGLVDYIYDCVSNEQVPQTLKDYTLDIISRDEAKEKGVGWIKLIPAGNVQSEDYWRKLASINWHDLIESREAIWLVTKLREKIKEEFNPDFLLIDSRTGVTEMSGLCTVILPDKVVFLMVNNHENLEGAKQILKGIKTPRPDGKQVDIIIVLTRIPYPRDEKEAKYKRELIKYVKKTLGVQNVFVLHSERNLEMSESLVIRIDAIDENSQLFKDYLRLFSHIIPEDLVKSKIEKIIDKIWANIRDNPDEVQKNLESLVKYYPYPITYESLIDLYFVRNVDEEKIIETFHKLWEISGKFSDKMLKKYVSLFKKETWDADKFKLDIIEDYVNKYPEDVAVLEKLAEVYEIENPRKAIDYYFKLFDNLEDIDDKVETLSTILDICIDDELYEIGLNIIREYSEIISKSYSLTLRKIKLLLKLGKFDDAIKVIDNLDNKEKVLYDILDFCVDYDLHDVANEIVKKYNELIFRNPSLVVKYIELLYHEDRIGEIKKLLIDEKIISEDFLFDYDSMLYVRIMRELGLLDKVYEKLDIILDEAIAIDSPRRILEIGKLYYELGKVDEFKQKITKYRWADEIIGRLERYYRRRKSKAFF